MFLIYQIQTFIYDVCVISIVQEHRRERQMIITQAILNKAREETGLKINLWEKAGKTRIYVQDSGYITEDGNDVKGKNNDYFEGFWYQYDRPGKVGNLRDVIRAIIAQ